MLTVPLFPLLSRHFYYVVLSTFSSFRRSREAREVGHIFRRQKPKERLDHEVQPW